jgi:hypothetical protein
VSSYTVRGQDRGQISNFVIAILQQVILGCTGDERFHGHPLKAMISSCYSKMMKPKIFRPTQFYSFFSRKKSRFDYYHLQWSYTYWVRYISYKKDPKSGKTLTASQLTHVWNAFFLFTRVVIYSKGGVLEWCIGYLLVNALCTESGVYRQKGLIRTQ